MGENIVERLHREAMEKIENAKDLRELPAVSKKMLLVKLKDYFERENLSDVDYSDMVEIADSLLRDENISDSLLATLRRLGLEEEEIQTKYGEIFDSIAQDVSLDLMVEELSAKDKKVAEIYTLRHEEVMKQIEEATKLEELPTNRTTSVLTNYLKANSSVYMDGVNFTASDFSEVTYLLLSGKRIEDEEVKQVITNMVNGKYPENSERISKLLIEKLEELPNTNNLVEEINKKNEKDGEFLEKGLKDVNIYYLPMLNPRAPREGGNNYVCYINTGKILAMDQLLPEIKEKGLRDPKDIVTYVRENYDPTFSISGSSILKRGHRIRTVYAGGELLSRQRDSEGYVTISTEEYAELLKAREENKRYKSFYGIVSDAVKVVEKENQEDVSRTEEVNQKEDFDVKDDSKDEI